MHLDPAAFNNLLNDIGQSVAWRQASACPCRAPRSGAADPSCPQCHGLGWWWSGPVTGILALSGQKVQREWAQFGMWQSGDQVVSLPSDSAAYAMGPFDRVIMLQSTVPFSVVLRPGEGLRKAIAELTSASWFSDGAMTLIYDPLLGADGRPVMTGITPPADAQLAVNGREHPEFFVYQEIPQDRAHHGGLPLPRRVVLRRFDLFGRGP
jgi:hypothetical protein